MKYIITEEQSSRFKEFILSMFRDGKNPDDIIDILGIPLEMVVDTIMDEEIKPSKYTDICGRFYSLLYNFLKPSGNLEKKRKYEDGSKIELYYDNMSGSISYEYINNEGYKLFGYATLFWDGNCALPIDAEEFVYDGVVTTIHKFSMLTLTDENQYLMTCRDLIEFHNGQYFELLKEKLDEFIEEIKEEHIV